MSTRGLNDDLALSSSTLLALKEFYSSNKSRSDSDSHSNNNNKQSIDNDNNKPLIDNNKQFIDKDYWDDRFKIEEQYDWLLKYDDIKQYLSALIKSSDSILILGCGNSTLSESLYDDGYHNITNIDYSDTVIEKLSLKHQENRQEMRWIVMDMTKLSFDSESFDIVIDKASMDALTVDEEDVWDPNLKTVKLVDDTLKGVSNVLKNNGVFIQITFSQPHFRTKYLFGSRATTKLDNDSDNSVSPYSSLNGHCLRYNWNLNEPIIIQKEEGCLALFMYVMTKSIIESADKKIKH